MTDRHLSRLLDRRRLRLAGDGSTPDDPGVRRLVAGLGSDARRLWRSMRRGSDARPFLWPDLASPTDPSDHHRSYDRVRTMAIAYAAAGSGLHADPALAADLVAAVDWLHDHRYSPTRAATGNWWQWEIGTPLCLGDVCVLLRDELGPQRIARDTAAIAHFAPDPRRTYGCPATGANLAWACLVATLRAALGDDPATAAAVRGAIGPVFDVVADGDGFHPDGSFIQHDDFPYTGGYGASLLRSVAELGVLLDGTPWEITPNERRTMVGWVFDAFDPVLHRGAIMDMTRGREIARPGSTDRAMGHAVLGGILSLAQLVPDADAAALRALVAGHLRADTARDFFGYAPGFAHNTPVGTAVLAADLLASGEPGRGDLVGHRQFPAMDRVVHRRPGFAVGIAMSSRRTRTYESINEENLRGWYTADGMVYLYDDDLSHYSDQFWSTVDWHRLPGTTVDTRSRDAVSRGNADTYRPPSSWVGGAVLDDRYGAVGMELATEGCTLTARKSWFCLDDQVVCLGAGITASDGRAVETVVENRRIRGDQVVTVDGRPLPGGAFDEVVEGVRSMHVDGVGSHLFPGPVTLHVRREARTGSWTSVSGLPGVDPTPHTRAYLTAWIDHGVDPAGASYAYVLCPGPRPEPAPVEIIANDADVQAVHAGAVTLVNVWAATGGRAAGIAVNGPASVVTRQDDEGLTVAVSDPIQENRGPLTVECGGDVEGVLTSDPGVSAARTGSAVALRVNVAGAAGRTFTARLRRADVAPPDALEEKMMRLRPQPRATPGPAIRGGRR